MAQITKGCSFVWLDGGFIPWEKTAIHPMAHTLHYGMGVFEGLRVYSTSNGPAIFRLLDHTNRLFRSASIVDMKIPYTPEEVNSFIIALIQKNNISSAYIRPMAFYGEEFLSLHGNYTEAHLMIAELPLGKYHEFEENDQGLRLLTSSYTRNNVNTLLLKGKINGSYVNSILSYQEALKRGCDDGLMLDPQGFVGEASSSNIFVIHDGLLSTPKADCIFPGLTRDTIIKLAADEDLRVVERNLTRDELYYADEIFLSGTAIELSPVTEIDGRSVGDGKVGPISKKISRLFEQVVRGENPKYLDWLTIVT